MGLRDKLKDAIHGDRDDETYGSTHATSGNHATSGGYAAQNDPKYGATTGAGTGRDYQTSSYQNPSATNDPHSNTVGGNIGHRQQDSGVHFGDNNKKSDKYGATTATSQDPYWGSVGQGGRNSPPGTSHTLTGEDERNRLQRKDLPLRPNEQQGAVSNIGGGRLDDAGRGGPTASSGGGTYNTVAGAGSRDYDNRGNHTLNAVGYQNQPSGIRGQTQANDDGYDSRLRDRDLGRDNTAAQGAGAGLTGAGLAGGRGREFDQRADADSRDMGLNPSDQYQTGGGVPQSSMLDPYQTGPNAGRAGQGDFGTDRTADPRFGSDRNNGPGAFNQSSAGAYGTAGNNGPVHDSRMANKLDPRVDSDRDGSHTLGGNRGVQGNDGRSGLGAAGQGPGHYGPAHEGAKVMHRCAGCGMDNDISQYFRKDAVYRMS